MISKWIIHCAPVFATSTERGKLRDSIESDITSICIYT